MASTTLRRVALLLQIAALLYAAGWLSSSLWAYRDFSQVLLCVPTGLNAHDAALFGTVLGWGTFMASPLIEELVFRRLLFTAMQRVRLGAAFTAASALLFALAHTQYSLTGRDGGNLLHLAVDGLVFARVFLIRRSVADAYLTHLASNCLVLLPKDLVFGRDACAAIGQPIALALWIALVAAAALLSSRAAFARLKAASDP